MANVKDQVQTRVSMEGEAGKFRPPGLKILTTEGKSFAWDSYIGGPWTLDAGDTLNIKSHLWELDGNAWLKAVLEHFSDIFSKNDDYIGSKNFDIGPNELAEIATSASSSRTYPLSYNNGSAKHGDFTLSQLREG